MSSPFICNWGILATGGIAGTFARDLLLDPASRDVADVQHRIVAVASSSSAARAQAFVDDDLALRDAPQKPSAYGTYAEMLKNDDVHIVYVATPHSLHYENVLQCLEAGKHVCCEKPMTINAKQTAHLIALAKEKNLFLMEALWIRFFPLMAELRKQLHEQRVIGDIVRVESYNGMAFAFDAQHRLWNPELGGGSLLDLGIYSLTWQMVTLFEDPRNERTPPKVHATIIKQPQTGVDESTTMLLEFAKSHTHGVCSSNAVVRTHHAYSCVIQGTKGDIAVAFPPFRPESFSVALRNDDALKTLGARKTYDFPIPGHGMFWEADAAARCLRDGTLQPELHPNANAQLTMEIMDEARKQGGFAYPDKLEWVREDAPQQ